ncbi:lipoprotein-releasing system ATP-binding protein [Breznakibacter xylanolyticus]|uniref:Lipoprotein-releasing system ATP-binding protein n=2 Tax=Breznakibacter xylanolyticus TaxID=990 RepID=A0A2W7NJP3_9BACT|nr:ABC transporter ATP-binding protein [Breznakibacter xylanolyticus]PZX20665.1 lipoprotein-releasing system ATP-binding protein [Breznakibacter xylanolyticus]
MFHEPVVNRLSYVFMVNGINITRSFGDLQVLKGINIDIHAGEILSIVGASGAGKTTLLQILGTLDKPTGGSICINGIDLSTLNDRQLAQFRNKHIGFVFQFHQLLPEFTALENVMMPALIAGTSRTSAMARSNELLGFLGLSHRTHHKPSQLSGGEKQRVAVARALINDPAVVFADEPSGNLDSHNQEELQVLFRRLREDFHQTFVIVTHDAHLATLSDRVVHMRDGLIVEG